MSQIQSPDQTTEAELVEMISNVQALPNPADRSKAQLVVSALALKANHQIDWQTGQISVVSVATR